MSAQKKTPKAIARKAAPRTAEAAADERARRLAAVSEWFYRMKVTLDELYFSAERVHQDLRDPASPLREFLSEGMAYELVGALDDATGVMATLWDASRLKLPDPTAV